MRSRLLLSVAHLPTIRETSEEILPGGTGQDPPASPSLDDYVRSICQLAQPTSLLDKVTARSQPSRPHRSAQSSKKSHPAASLQDNTASFSGQQSTLPSAGTTDPLDWIFGESQRNETNKRDLLRRTGPSAGHWSAHSEANSGKPSGSPRRRLFEARAFGHSLTRPSQDVHQSSNLNNWTSGQPGGATASPCNPRPSSILRSLYLHLPVIHEL
ncbi:protein DEPP1 [Callospermophilus lateralis]|uniref:protein DEPP1 n=1 Tax=Callospermophilus lateralis TaxID=76772 RepID=UPI0040386783